MGWADGEVFWLLFSGADLAKGAMRVFNLKNILYNISNVCIFWNILCFWRVSSRYKGSALHLLGLYFLPRTDAWTRSTHFTCNGAQPTTTPNKLLLVRSFCDLSFTRYKIKNVAFFKFQELISTPLVLRVSYLFCSSRIISARLCFKGIVPCVCMH